MSDRPPFQKPNTNTIRQVAAFHRGAGNEAVGQLLEDYAALLERNSDLREWLLFVWTDNTPEMQALSDKELRDKVCAIEAQRIFDTMREARAEGARDVLAEIAKCPSSLYVIVKQGQEYAKAICQLCLEEASEPKRLTHKPDCLIARATSLPATAPTGVE